MPVMFAPCGGSATATGIVCKGNTEIKAMAKAKTTFQFAHRLIM
jgi:hypothetical protein